MQIDVCFIPDFIQNHEYKNKTLVVIDIFRASSTIVSALASGFELLKVLNSAKDIPLAKESGYLIAAEQDAKKLYNADFGNSPLSFIDKSFKDKRLAFYSTNGTRALNILKIQSELVLIASFLNLDAVAIEISKNQKDCILVCSGWKSNFSMEDSLFAGALIEKLTTDFAFSFHSDEAIAALSLWNLAKSNLVSFLADCEHYNRLKNLGFEEDALFCLTANMFEIVPKFNPLNSIIKQ